MTLRGLISPPRSRSSPRESRALNNNNAITANNPPSRPNYMSPCRRPTTVVNPNEQRSRRKETQTRSTTTNLKATATRAIKNNNSKYASQSPPRNRSSTSKPATKIVSSRRQTAAPNPKDHLQTQKKLDNKNNHSTHKTTYSANTTRPSSPRTMKPISTQPRGPTLRAGARASGVIAKDDTANLMAPKYSDSPKHLGSPHQHQQDVNNIGNLGNQNHDSGGHYADLHSRLQQLSIDGTDLSNIVLHANSIYESMGSDAKEECSSSQTSSNGPKIFKIYKDIATHRQGNSSVTSYFTKLKAMWDELAITYVSDDHAAPQIQCCSCGEDGERDKVVQFLVGLDDSYSSICAQILGAKPFPTVEKAYGVIIREEKRRELVLSLEIVAAKVMQNKWLLQNDVSSSNGDEGIEVEEHQIYQNDTTVIGPVSIYNPDVHEPLLIDLGSPVRC